MRQPHIIDLNEHNRRQIRYFDPSLKRTMVPMGSCYLRRHVDESLHFADISPGERVLEVGCGMGRYTLLLAEQGVDVTWLDLSPVLLDRLRAHDGGRVPDIDGDDGGGGAGEDQGGALLHRGDAAATGTVARVQN